MSAFSPVRQSNQSSMRLLQIMECLAASRTPMRLQDVAKQVGMTQSTVLRYLYSLEQANYIYQDEETSRYALTWKVCRLGENLNSYLGLRNITTSFVNQLANSLSLGACLVVEDSSECMYLDHIDNPNSPTLQRIGKQAPLHATGSGKVLLSQFSEQRLAQYIAEKGLTRYTEYTITDPATLREELARIRRQDFAMDEQECEIGLRCLSCPLRNYTGHVIAAVSVFGNVLEMSDRRIQHEIYPALREKAAIISTRLGYCGAQEAQNTAACSVSSGL